MIPIIDFNDPNHLKHIEEAYTTVGFAVFKKHFIPTGQN